MSTNGSRRNSPVSSEHVEHAVDDSMVRDQPSRCVDYLFHDWQEEDIWSSRKHLLSKRNAYGNTARLENILWRTWTKSRHRLKTVPAENLNWLKDCDVTWLYGPLHASPDKFSRMPISLGGIGISKLSSSVHKKSILKKRSVLETMFQQPLSESWLPSRSAAVVHAQRSNPTFLLKNSDTASMGRAASGYATSSFSLRPVLQDDGNEFPSISSSGEQSPVTSERKRIHFNDKVECWMAVDIVDGSGGADGIESYTINSDDDDSSSDDEFLMMKGSARPESLSRSNRSNRGLP